MPAPYKPSRRPFDHDAVDALLGPYEQRTVPPDFDPATRHRDLELSPSRRHVAYVTDISISADRLAALYYSGRIDADEYIDLCFQLTDIIISRKPSTD
jgi:hypothetical protein